MVVVLVNIRLPNDDKDKDNGFFDVESRSLCDDDDDDS